MLRREGAYHELVKLVGVHEVGANNRGPAVDQLEDLDKLPGHGYPWCQSTQNASWLRATGMLLANGTASVEVFHGWASQQGYLMRSPERFDHILFWKHGGWNHVGQLERVLSFGSLLVAVTIEGNTPPYGALEIDANSGRDGVYRKRRVVARSAVSFVRVPGELTADQAYRYLTAKEQELLFWLWLRWNLGEQEYKRFGPSSPRHRPFRVPARVPEEWWTRRQRFLEQRRRVKPRR